LNHLSADECEIASGAEVDCNLNGVPDSCELAAGTAFDCNGNGVLDQCDIAAGTSEDCNGNGIADECEVASGREVDCNGNGILDSCEFLNGTGFDCNENGTLDQPSAALVQDLEERGLLDDTIVVWGGEFGRTVYSQGELTEQSYGRDHHPRCFPIWLAGGGFAPGVRYGETCDHSYKVVRDPVSTHDLHATLLHQLGLDHERLTYRFQGRDFRLTDVHGEVVGGILA